MSDDKQLTFPIGANPSDGSRGNAPISSLDSNVTKQIEDIIDSRRKKCTKKLSNIKVVKTGKHIEVHFADKPYVLERPKQGPSKKIKKGKKKNKTTRSKEYRERTVKRAMDKIKRLTKGNFDNDYTKLLTLTFADDLGFDTSDIAVCNKKFTYFIGKLRKIDPDFMYIKVPEYHKKRNVVHYHVICNLKYIEQSKLQDLWGYGIVDIRKAPKSVAGYLYKYLMKNVEDERYIGKRTWSSSRNMESSKKIYRKNAWKIADELKDKGCKPEFKYNYGSKFNGNIRVYEFTED